MRRRATAPVPSRVRTVRLTLVAIVATASCTSPAAVRRYATSATAVTMKLPAVTDALSASCRRTESYRLRRTSSSWYGDDSVRVACAARDRALREVVRVNAALAAYFHALSALAADKVIDLDGTVNAVGMATADAGLLDTKQEKALAALARFASSRLTDGYRRATLRAAIADQNANVQLLTAALHEIIERDFAQLLGNDDAAETSFYRAALTESSSSEPLAAILVRDSYDERQALLDERRKAVAALARAVSTVGRGHQALYDARDHLGSKELLKATLTSAHELDDALAKVARAF
jgi:hypothetical protein